MVSVMAVPAYAATDSNSLAASIIQEVGGILSYLVTNIGSASTLTADALANVLTSLQNALSQLSNAIGGNSSSTGRGNGGGNGSVPPNHGGTVGESQDHILVKFKDTVGQTKRDQVLAAHGLSVKGQISDIGVQIIGISASDTPEEVIDRLHAQESASVLFAEPDSIASITATPNDPQYPNQWHLPQISAPAGWDVTTGAPGVIIAVIDTGIDTTHPDFAGKLVSGYNFVAQTTDVTDLNGHGTQTAGTAAADTNNGVGVAGVDWQSQIMPLVACDSGGNCQYSAIESAITYAADHGAKVISISIGGTSDSSALQSAINYAWNKGLVIVAASGNGGTNMLYYPGGDQNVVGVGATCDTLNTLCGFSNYGTGLDVVAPGGNIFTTAAGGGYTYDSGTSFSTPIVSGVAALLFAKNPSLSNSQVVSLLESGADPLPAGSTGWNQSFGYGMVDVAKSLAATGQTNQDTIPPSAPANLNGSAASATQANIGWSASTDNVGVMGYYVYRNGAKIATTQSASYTDNSVAGGTSYSYYVTAYDAAGNVSGQSNTITVTTPVAVVTVSVTSYQVTNKTANTATVTWTTNIPSTGMLAYGTSKTNLSLTIPDTSIGTSHTVTLTGLTRFTTYYYQVRAVSQDATSNASSPVTNFKTARK